MARKQTTDFLFDNPTKIKKPKESFNNLEKYYKAGKISLETYNYLSKKYYTTFRKGDLDLFLG